MIAVRAGDEQVLVALNDGSRVTLNNNAELRYPEKFRGDKREVLLSGEAFFEVERNPEKPFTINIEDMAIVEVLGTSFNIRSEESGESTVCWWWKDVFQFQMRTTGRLVLFWRKMNRPR